MPKVLFDCDPGVDDSVALLLALAAWRAPLFRELRQLPSPEDPTLGFGAEASVSAVVP